MTDTPIIEKCYGSREFKTDLKRPEFFHTGNLLILLTIFSKKSAKSKVNIGIEFQRNFINVAKCHSICHFVTGGKRCQMLKIKSRK